MSDHYIPGLVSAVTPAYNAAGYLREAIQSALDQTYRPIEVIVVDDGSTDRTRDVCRSFGTIVRYFHQENDGTYGLGARTRAIREARGEWIALLDQDDRWLPTKIERQVDSIRDNSQAALVFTNYRYVNATGEVIQHDVAPTAPSGYVFHRLLEGYCYAASTALVRHSAVDRNYSLRSPDQPGDFDLWLGLTRDHEVHYIGQELCEMRKHDMNYSRIHLEKQIGDLMSLICRYKSENWLHDRCRDCIVSFAEGMGFYRRVLAYYLLTNGYQHATAGDLRAAARCLLIALWNCPSFVLSPRRLVALRRHLTRKGLPDEGRCY